MRRKKKEIWKIQIITQIYNLIIKKNKQIPTSEPGGSSGSNFDNFEPFG